jgi:hypothetical protein
MPQSHHAQINENHRFQAWFWAVQRVAWVGFGVLVVAALLGFTGGGGRYAQGHIADEFMTLTYPAVTRRRAEAVLDIVITGTQPQTFVQFDAGFQDAFSVISMVPPASSAVATQTGTTYSFDLSWPGPKLLRLGLSGRVVGIADYTVVVDGRAVALSSLILP